MIIILSLFGYVGNYLGAIMPAIELGNKAENHYMFIADYHAINAEKNAQFLNQKIKELDKKVEWFSSDDFKLGEAVKEYKEALELAEEIEEDLKNLKNEIEILDVDFSKDVI